MVYKQGLRVSRSEMCEKKMFYKTILAAVIVASCCFFGFFVYNVEACMRANTQDIRGEQDIRGQEKEGQNSVEQRHYGVGYTG